MNFQATSVLGYALPPVLGAVIGYVTNALAIKMLFRPLTEKRFLGIRIPFTPGIIPKKRYDLAHSIGTMVSRELLTEGIVAERLNRENFRDSIRIQISRFTEDIVSAPISRLFDNQDAEPENRLFPV
ncbi:MAG: DUF445 family protein, partial [Spirochaetales bacterium]